MPTDDTPIEDPEEVLGDPIPRTEPFVIPASPERTLLKLPPQRGTLI